MKARAKSCSICKTKFHPKSSFDKTCGDFECKVAFAEKVAAKSKAKREKEAKQQQAAERREHRKKVIEAKPVKYWEDRAQSAINEYVRLRDNHLGCCSCDRPANWDGQWHASHLKSRGANSFLRFNLWNLNKSCSICNNHLSGNVGEYEKRLVEKIGQERVDYLNTAPRSRKYDIEYLQRLEAIFKRKSKILKKRLGLN